MSITHWVLKRCSPFPKCWAPQAHGRMTALCKQTMYQNRKCWAHLESRGHHTTANALVSAAGIVPPTAPESQLGKKKDCPKAR